MKKILLIIIMMMPLIVNADVKVTNHIIDSEIEIAGALNVKELIVVEGDTSKFTRTINYYSFGEEHWDGDKIVDLNDGIIYNAQDVSVYSVSAYEFDGKLDFDTLGKNLSEYFTVFDIDNPQEKTYILDDNKKGTATLTINYPTNGKKTAYFINYIIGNAVVKHKDIKEINYTFKNLNYKSPNTILRVIIPYATQDDIYHVWVHGNQSGSVTEIINKNNDKLGIYCTFPKVKDAINFRMTLPEEQVGIDMFLNNTNIDALDKVIEIETEKMNITNRSNLIIEIMKYVLRVLGIIYIIGSFFILNNYNKVLFIVYLLFGLFLCLFNFLFGFNYWYLYSIMIMPVLVFLLKKLVVK